jgi:hypothetical protein
MRSLRSWCVSSSSRMLSNMGMNGDEDFGSLPSKAVSALLLPRPRFILCSAENKWWYHNCRCRALRFWDGMTCISRCASDLAPLFLCPQHQPPPKISRVCFPPIPSKLHRTHVLLGTYLLLANFERPCALAIAVSLNLACSSTSTLLQPDLQRPARTNLSCARPRGVMVDILGLLHDNAVLMSRCVSGDC